MSWTHPLHSLKRSWGTGYERAGPRTALERVAAETKEPQPEQNQLQNNKTQKTWTSFRIPGGRFVPVGGAVKDRTECAWVLSWAYWNPVFKMNRWPHTKALTCVFEVHTGEFWQIKCFLSPDNFTCGNLCFESLLLKRKLKKINK